MPPRFSRPQHIRHAAYALLAAALFAFVPVSAVAAPSETPPQLSIAVDDGQTSAVAGDKLAYTLTVTNLGTKRVQDLLVTQSVPAGSKLASKDNDAVETQGTVTWKLNLDPTKKATLKMSLTVLKTSNDVLRLATVACAKVSKKAAPLVCASDSNQLPAGAAAQAQQDESTETSGFLSTPHLGWYVAGGIALLAAIALGIVLIVRSRRRPAAGVSQPPSAPAPLG